MYFLCKYLLIIANIVSVEKLVNFICLSTTYFYLSRIKFEDKKTYIRSG